MVLIGDVELSSPVVVLPGRSVVVVFIKPVVVSDGTAVVELIWIVVFNTPMLGFIGVILIVKPSAFKTVAVKTKVRKNMCKEFIANCFQMSVVDQSEMLLIIEINVKTKKFIILSRL